MITTKSLPKQHLGSLYAIISGLCYGFTGYFGISLINSGLSIFNMLFWRFSVSAVIIAAMLLFNYKTILQIQKKDLNMLFYGVFFYGTSTISYFLSSKYVGTGVAMVVLFTYPAFVMLFNVAINKVKLSKIYYLAFFMLFLGTICLIDIYKLAIDLKGIVFGVVAALCYACYMLASKKNTSSPLTSTLMVSLGCALACLVAAYCDASFCLPNSSHLWGNVLCIAIICSALPILLLLQALKYINTEKASILSVLEPVFVVICGILLLGEGLTTIKAIGVLVILSGALITLMYDQNIDELKAGRL